MYKVILKITNSVARTLSEVSKKVVSKYTINKVILGVASIVTLWRVRTS
jgi:hypothetical protein